MREEERAMPWARLDDGFYDHPKILDVSLAAAGLFSIGLSYCSVAGVSRRRIVYAYME